MDDKVYKLISDNLGISQQIVEKVVAMLNDGATIPFISRYRKEATNNLDELAILDIQTQYNKFKEIVERKKYIIETLTKQEKLTDELLNQITSCWDSDTLEDIYLPYKQKRRTKAEIARENGLEPLAKIIFCQKYDIAEIQRYASNCIKSKNLSGDSAIDGALDIISEWISENQTVRRTVRTEFQRYATIRSKVVESKRDEASKYSNYFDYAEKLSRASSHRILAIRRAEREGLMKVSIDVDADTAIEKISRIILKRQSASSELISRAIKEAYKRLIKPSIENEFARISKDIADESAIEVFSSNLRQLLMQAPLGEKRVLGVDPGFRTGCKIVCLDENGKLLHNDVIYPNQPKSDFRGAAKKISTIIESYKIDAIAIGNGTASRETEKFFQSLRYGANMQIFVVSEDGASIYSASKLAREEFPDKDVTVRGAVSIGRRLIDPLAELVKIDPKSIGVGQYQYDVDQNKLQQSLNFTVESCVNTVGVNVNTASKELLGYVSGLGPSLAGNIVKYRQEHGSFRNRSELLKVDRLGPKAFQQASGFLRIIDGDNPLDSTFVHPESYPIVKQMAKDCNCSLNDFVNDTSKRASIDLNKYVSAEHGLTTLQSIINEIGCRGIDPRHKTDTFAFDERINSLSDLKEGMVVNGIVTNITQFGAFVDIGIKENGLIHISEMSDNYISSPNDVLRINQHLQVKVISVDESRKRISLSLKGL